MSVFEGLNHNNRPDTRRYHVESLARGLRVLELFSDKEPWLGQNEIMRRTGLTASTTVRLVRTLEALGFLEQSPDTKKYRPGLAVMKLGHAAIAGLGLREAAYPYLHRLAADLDETVNLGILAGNRVVYIERIEKEKILKPELHVGSSLPANSTSIGKMLLAHLSDEDLRNVLEQTDFAATGPNTITSEQELVLELQAIREADYAIQDEELVAGLRSVATPVRNHLSQPIAAVNVAVPSQRVSKEELLRVILPAVSNATAGISAALGARNEHVSRAAGNSVISSNDGRQRPRVED